MPVALLLDWGPSWHPWPGHRRVPSVSSSAHGRWPKLLRLSDVHCLQAVAFAKSFVLAKGPIILEMDTYR